MRKWVTAKVSFLAFCVIMVAGVAFGAQQLTLTFQDGVNDYTGTLDHQLFEALDEQDEWTTVIRPAMVGNSVGTGDRSSFYLGQYLDSPWYQGQFHAALIQFTGAFEAWQALPGTPILDGVTLTVSASTGSGGSMRYLEVAKVTDPSSNGMWKEMEYVGRLWWDIYDDDPHPYASVPTNFYETDASYRSGGNPGNNFVQDPEEPVPTPWDMPHNWGVWTTVPFTGVPADAGDHGPMVDYAGLDRSTEEEFFDFDVTPIFQDWINGDPCQGFHLCIGLNFTEGNWQPFGISVVTHDGALGEGGDPTQAPKLTITYHYDGSSEADAGESQGTMGVGETNNRVKPGEEITLDGSLSTPYIEEYPIESYEWTWTYGTAQHYINSTNNQSPAQLPAIVPAADNISLTVIDELGLQDTDTTQVKVTPRIPGDIDGSGVVNLSDFVILRNNF